MTELNSNIKGKLTELRVLEAVIELGYSVSIPFGDKDRYDQIWDIDGKLLRVQVKTSRLNEKDKNIGDSIVFNCRTTYSRNTGSVTHKYNENEIDYFATVWEGKTYLVPVGECSDKKVLRFNSTVNNGTISWAKDYELKEVLKKI